MSIAPWHLGMLAALLRLFDTFVHADDPFPGEHARVPYNEKTCMSMVLCAFVLSTVPFLQALVKVQHVRRAWGLLRILLQMRAAWCMKPEADGFSPMSMQAASASFTAQPARHVVLPPAEASFLATQPGQEKLPVPMGELQAEACKVGKEYETAMQVGYGPEGISVQDPVSFLSDREI